MHTLLVSFVLCIVASLLTLQQYQLRYTIRLASMSLLEEYYPGSDLLSATLSL